MSQNKTKNIPNKLVFLAVNLRKFLKNRNVNGKS